MRLAVLLTALVAAAPAQAADRVLTKSRASLLTEDYIGQPLWALLAGCAGSHGAAHAYFTRLGQPADAEREKDDGARLLDLAVDRLVVDRRIDRPAALELTRPYVEQGRANGVAALAASRQHRGLQWLALKTSCDEFAGA